jgi:hypothetical protein
MSSAGVSGVSEAEQFYRRYPTTLRNCKTIGDVSTIYKVAKYSLGSETKVKEVLMEFMEKGYLTTTEVRSGMPLEWIGEADPSIIPNKSPKENKEKGPENLVHFAAQYFLEEAEMNPYERDYGSEDEYIEDPHIEPKRGIVEDIGRSGASPSSSQERDIRPTHGYLTLFANRYELEQFYLDTVDMDYFLAKHDAERAMRSTGFVLGMYGTRRAFNSAQVFNSLVKFHRIVKEKNGSVGASATSTGLKAKLVWGFRPPKASKWVSYSETKLYNPLDSMESLAMAFYETPSNKDGLERETWVSL